MSLPVAILAGGLATRLRPLTERIPKSLIEVAGRPFAEHQVELLRSGGITNIVFLVGYLGEMVRDALGDGARWGVGLRYIFDGPQILGTGGAIVRALPELGDAFFVLYGDSYLECDYQAVEHAFLQSGKDALMTVFRNEGRWDTSNVQCEQGHIVRYDKQHRAPEMHHVDYGLGVFSVNAFKGRHDAGEAFDLADLYQGLIAKVNLAGYEVTTRFYEIGSPAGLEETRAYLARKRHRS